MPTPYTRPFNDFEEPLTVAYVPGSGVLRFGDLSSLPAGWPSSANPLRFSCTRQKDGAKTILIATGRAGNNLMGVAATEGKTDIPLDAGDFIKMRLSAGYITQIQDDLVLAWAAIADIQVIGTGPATSLTYPSENVSTGNLHAGTAVAVYAGGTGIQAASSADNLANAVGIMIASVIPNASGTYTVDGPLTLADWSVSTGSATLSPRATYFLGVTPGTLTTTPPSTPGKIVQVVGVAVSPSTLDVSISPPILL